VFNRIFKARGVWFAALLFAFFLSPVAATGAEADSQPASTSTAVEPPAGDPAFEERITRPPDEVPLPELPSDPVEALITAVNAHSASLGFTVDHGPAIRDSGISPEYAGRVALLMQAVLTCNDADTGAKQTDCAAAANDAAAGVIQSKEEPNFSDIDAWPSLYIDGDGGNDTYVNDYSILLDRGGNDIYDNNAGGNLQDIRRGPEGSVALEHGPAIGCEHPQTAPNVPPSIPPPQDCIAARQVVFIDQKSDSGPSDDVYGVFKPPEKVDPTPPPVGPPRRPDGDCTADPVIRRIVTEGSGFEGNALLIDDGGNDHYNGKTVSQGSGHLGVGVLRDLGGGNDDYLAIRNSQGFALLATDAAGQTADGLLEDDGGNDRYHTYMPRPLDPNAWFQAPGSGGVVDDFNNCDNMPRDVQGAALLGGTGHLLDKNGRDTYEGSPKDTQNFLPPAVQFRHSSQGFGCDTGVGILTDEGSDKDKYLRGPKNRKNGASISETDTNCFAAPGQGIFQDDGG
jgi:hypothetical protein